MNFKNSLFILLASVSFVAVINAEGPICSSEQSCKDLDDQNCQCWCSVKCGPRAKTPEDSPIFFANPEDDPYGKKCYCAPRDLELFEQNCAGK